jgi:hypothetical protein
MTETLSDAREANGESMRKAFETWTGRNRPDHRHVRAGHGLADRGRSLASKEYRSTQDFIDLVLAPAGARFSSLEPFRPRRIRSVDADGDTVIVL